MLPQPDETEVECYHAASESAAEGLLYYSLGFINKIGKHWQKGHNRNEAASKQQAIMIYLTAMALHMREVGLMLHELGTEHEVLHVAMVAISRNFLEAIESGPNPEGENHDQTTH